jgi:hypothetical protein
MKVIQILKSQMIRKHPVGNLYKSLSSSLYHILNFPFASSH